MRGMLILATLCGCGFAACTAPARERALSADDGAYVEATYRRAAADLPPDLLDPVANQLLRAALDVLDQRRCVALENLANNNTPGFKRRVATVTVQQLFDGGGRAFSAPVSTGSRPVFTPGCLERTGRDLDLAIDGAGLFAVIRHDGSTAYTRNGQLAINADGKLVTCDGRIVLPEITVPCDILTLTIDDEGRVTGVTAGSPDTSTQFGQLNIHRFVNPEGLTPDGPLWRPNEASGQPITSTPGSIGLGLLRQGFLERANVEVREELRELQRIGDERASLVAAQHSTSGEGR